MCIKTEWPSKAQTSGSPPSWLGPPPRKVVVINDSRDTECSSGMIKYIHAHMHVTERQPLWICLMFARIYFGAQQWLLLMALCSGMHTICRDERKRAGEGGRTEGRRGSEAGKRADLLAKWESRAAQSGLLLTQGDSKCKWMNTNDRRNKEGRLRGGEGRTGRSG